MKITFSGGMRRWVNEAAKTAIEQYEVREVPVHCSMWCGEVGEWAWTVVLVDEVPGDTGVDTPIPARTSPKYRRF